MVTLLHSEDFAAVLAPFDEMRGHGDAVHHHGFTRGGGRRTLAALGARGGSGLVLILAGFATADDLGPLLRPGELAAVDGAPHDAVLESHPVPDPRESLGKDHFAGRAHGNPGHVLG